MLTCRLECGVKMAVKEKYDLKKPGTRKLVEKIHHGVYVKEGLAIAFPLCFPGATIQIPHDESFITALSVGPRGMIYGGTSGAAAHIFVAMFKGVTGCVLDLGTPEKMNEVTSVWCGGEEWFAACNGKSGGAVFKGKCQPMPFDLIQEWSFTILPIEKVYEFTDEKIINVVPRGKKGIFIITDKRFMCITNGKEKVYKTDMLAERISPAADGEFLAGIKSEKSVWIFDIRTEKFSEIKLSGRSDRIKRNIVWTYAEHAKKLYFGDSSGNVFFVARNKVSRIGKTPLRSITTLTTIPDGRIYGTCGDTMEHIFCWNPVGGKIKDVGIAVSVIERRRYGYMFGAAVSNSDGIIFFGEKDNLGHLWLYFPPILGNK